MSTEDGDANSVRCAFRYAVVVGRDSKLGPRSSLSVLLGAQYFNSFEGERTISKRDTLTARAALHAIAVRQGGYVTTGQARSAGFAGSHL